MRKILFSTFLPGVLFASDMDLPSNRVRIAKGDTEISGSFGGGYATGGIGFFFGGDLTGLHYVFDKFALGVETKLFVTTGMAKVQGFLGPVVKYNFWDKNDFTVYVKASYLTDVSNPFHSDVLEGDLGLDYFITNNFSIGPYLRVTHFIDTFNYDSRTDVVPGGKIALHF